MEAYQNIFKRKEKKFLLSKERFEALMDFLDGRIVHDKYPKTQIRSLYFDTPTRILIRRSLERPVFKEKLRVRTYGDTDGDIGVFLELKKKYKGVVFKRRIALSYEAAKDYLIDGIRPKEDDQILREIDAFLKQYRELAPSMLIMCRRESFLLKEDPSIRITFDSDILYRETDLDPKLPVFGAPLLKEGQRLMEIKAPNSIPLWLSKKLSEEQIFSNRFSKYGNAYIQSFINQGDHIHA